MNSRLVVILVWFFVLAMVGTGCSTVGTNDTVSQDNGSKLEQYADDTDWHEGSDD